jgi:hypothetical protein
MFGFQRNPVFREAGFGEFHCICIAKKIQIDPVLPQKITAGIA